MIDILPLRQRPGDIRVLAERYLAYFSRQNNRRIAGFSNDATQRACKIKQLAGATIESCTQPVEPGAVILCTGDYIEIDHFLSELQQFRPDISARAIWFRWIPSKTCTSAA